MELPRISFKDFLKQAKRIAYDRDSAKLSEGVIFAETPNLTGVLGEYVYSRLTGEPMDLSISGSGDPGQDFPYRDVKGNLYFREPHIRLFLKDLQKPAIFYIGVAIDMDTNSGWVHGWAPKSRFVEKWRKKDFSDYGGGQRLTADTEEQTPGLDPIGMELYLKRRRSRKTPEPFPIETCPDCDHLKNVGYPCDYCSCPKLVGSGHPSIVTPEPPKEICGTPWWMNGDLPWKK